MPTSDSDNMILLEMPDMGRKGPAKSLLKTLKTIKPANLPAWKTIAVDIEHIASGHMKGGSRVSSIKTVFPDNLSEGQVENLVRSAYKNSKKVKTQGDRVLLRGNDIEMWVNTKTKTIETAYPIIKE
ncbi:EndoU domain-containing protein [Chryseobacterium sp. OSA05B]|uniref:EndoU domain-containing protein n=1 Tax=Chryseobacterium sp. OSA05B TaxID=2862650 RepID=UPI001CBD00E2|nr:EndoU domain-containing protein [Chryseobacterium sp. OSA05B]